MALIHASALSLRRLQIRKPQIFGFEEVAAGGALSGVSNLALTASGVLKGAGALSGVSNLALTLAGNLTNFSAGAMSGVSNLALTASGVLKGAGALSGVSNLALTASGNLTNFGSGAIITDWIIRTRRRRR